MITLHTMPRIGWGLLAPSPFCLKVEVHLILTGLPCTLAPTLMAVAGPKKKLPWIEDEGQAIADSETIVAHLTRRAGDPLGEAATPAAQRHREHLLRRTIEESLYFALVSERWRQDEVFDAYARDLLAGLPAMARPGLRWFARRNLLNQLWHQGYGRHTPEETTARGVADIDAIASALGDLPFFGGASPRAIDASAFGSLANAWYIPVDTGLRRAVGSHPNLVGWLERMKERCGMQG